MTTTQSIFQREVENLLQDLSHVVVYLDGMLVTDQNYRKYLENCVLNRLKQTELKMLLRKCDFLFPQVKYLGNVITSAGFQPDQETTEAELKASQPSNVKRLRSYLVLVNFYRRFLANLLSVLQPFTHLAANTPWAWTTD